MEDLFDDHEEDALLYPDDAAQKVIMENELEDFEAALNEFVDEHGCYDIKYSTSRREVNHGTPPDDYVYHAALVIYPEEDYAEAVDDG